MKPNLILHIGTEKTGTSTIQEFLYQNRIKLEENGYHFLQCAGPKNNRALPAYVLNDTDSLNDDFFQLNGINTIEGVSSFRNEFNKQINEEIKGLSKNIHTVIISSEHFHSRVNKLESIQRLKDLTDTLFSKVTIICYLREQSQVCESWYSTALKNGHTSTFPDFVKSCTTNNIYFNYYNNLKNWTEIFGKEIIVKLFSKNLFIEGDLLKDFFYTISKNSTLPLDYNITNENESISPLGQHVIYSINHALKSCTDEKSRMMLINAKKGIVKDLQGKGQLVTKEEYLKIYNDFKSYNEKLFKAFPNLLGDNFPKRNLEDLPDHYNTAQQNALYDLVKTLTNVTIDITHKDIEKIRDIAIENEKYGHYESALYLMQLAQKSRPNGPIINRKIKKYSEIINKKNKKVDLF